MDSSTLQWLSVSQTFCEQGSGRGGVLEGADQEAATMGCDQGSLSSVPALDSSISRTSVTIPHPPTPPRSEDPSRGSAPLPSPPLWFRPSELSVLWFYEILKED